jgi:hypothetical protein
LAVIPKLLFPAVQLDAPLLDSDGLAAGDAEVASVRDESVPVLSGVASCCICAIPAQGKTITARIAKRIANKNARPALAPLMV